MRVLWRCPHSENPASGGNSTTNSIVLGLIILPGKAMSGGVVGGWWWGGTMKGEMYGGVEQVLSTNEYERVPFASPFEVKSCWRDVWITAAQEHLRRLSHKGNRTKKSDTWTLRCYTNHCFPNLRRRCWSRLWMAVVAGLKCESSGGEIMRAWYSSNKTQSIGVGGNW